MPDSADNEIGQTRKWDSTRNTECVVARSILDAVQEEDASVVQRQGKRNVNFKKVTFSYFHLVNI